MKKLIVLAVTLAGLVIAPISPRIQAAPVNQPVAIAPPFDNSFPKLQIHDAEIVWAAPTNQSRSTLWVYRVVPQKFPVSVLSNFAVMGSFSNKIENTDNPFSLVNASNTCHLQLRPSQGYVRYWNEYAPANHWDRTNHLWEQVSGVPSESKTEKLGLKVLKQFGIQSVDLAQKPNGRLLTFGEKQTRSYFDRRRNKDVKDEIIEMGVFFIRRIDGVNFAGNGQGGGCEIVFGNHANIADFKLVWRNLQRYEERRVASSNEIEGYIRDGQAVLTHKNLVNTSDIKKLTITDCSALYMGASAEETQNFVYPFAQVEAIADLGKTNVDIQLYCPILLTNSVKE